jgi:malonyl CoA-acyl carrier protein transacylase
MLSPALEQSLSVIELQCQAVAAAVASGEPQALESASNALKQAAVQFAQLVEQLGGPQKAGPELRARLKKAAVQLNIQRENLLRRAVVVERAVQTMVPAAVNHLTYGQHGRASGYKAFAA